MKQSPKEVSIELKEKEKQETYHAIIPKAHENQIENVEPKAAGEEAEALTQPAAQRYNTPESINELVDHENESDSKTW